MPQNPKGTSFGMRSVVPVCNKDYEPDRMIFSNERNEMFDFNSAEHPPKVWSGR